MDSIPSSSFPRVFPPLTRVEPNDQSGIIAIVTGFTLGLLLLSIVVRLYARRNAGPQRCDDGAFYTAVLFGLAEVCTTLFLISRGLGKDPGLLERGEEAVVRKGVQATEILYLVTLALSKVSCGVIYVCLTPFAGQKRAAWVLVGVSAVWGVSSLFVEGFGCSDLLGWCAGYRARWIYISVTDVLLEAALVGQSIHMVYSRSMSVRAKYSVVGAFSFRIPNMAITLVRLGFVCLNTAAPTLAIQIARVQATTQLAVGYTIVSLVIPYLRPLMQSYEDDGRNGSNEATFELSDRSKGSGSGELGEKRRKALGLEFSDMGKLLGPEKPAFVRFKSREMIERATGQVV